MALTDKQMTLVESMAAICSDKEWEAKDPVAWHNLHKEGLTRELLAVTSEGPEWAGNKPRFDLAPAYDSRMWVFLEEQADAKARGQS